MAKAFFEVFPQLKLSGHTKDLMGETVVEKVSATRKQDFIRIYISSDRLIDKQEILNVEKEIKSQLFGNVSIVIKIYERFHLSAQYTPSNLMDIYGESILQEFKTYNPIEYTLLKGAEFRYPASDAMEIVLEDSVTSTQEAPEIQRIMDKIINERCGLNIHISTVFEEKKSGKKAGAPDYSAESERMSARLEAALEAKRLRRLKKVKKALKKQVMLAAHLQRLRMLPHLQVFQTQRAHQMEVLQMLDQMAQQARSLVAQMQKFRRLQKQHLQQWQLIRAALQARENPESTRTVHRQALAARSLVPGKRAALAVA